MNNNYSDVVDRLIHDDQARQRAIAYLGEHDDGMPPINKLLGLLKRIDMIAEPSADDVVGERDQTTLAELLANRIAALPDADAFRAVVMTDDIDKPMLHATFSEHEQQQRVSRAERSFAATQAKCWPPRSGAVSFSEGQPQVKGVCKRKAGGVLDCELFTAGDVKPLSPEDAERLYAESSSAIQWSERGRRAKKKPVQFSEAESRAEKLYASTAGWAERGRLLAAKQ